MKLIAALAVIFAVGCSGTDQRVAETATQKPRVKALSGDVDAKFLDRNPFSHPALLVAAPGPQVSTRPTTVGLSTQTQLAPAPLTGDIVVVPAQRSAPVPDQTKPEAKPEPTPPPRFTLVLKAVVDAGAVTAYIEVEGQEPRGFMVGQVVTGNWHVVSVDPGAVVLASGTKRLTLNVGQTLEVPS